MVKSTLGVSSLHSLIALSSGMTVGALVGLLSGDLTLAIGAAGGAGLLARSGGTTVVRNAPRGIALVTVMLASVASVQAQPKADADADADTRSTFRADIAPAWKEFAPRYQRNICPFDRDVEFSEDVIECGAVLVPEDRTNPESRLIRLAVMHVKSSSAKPPGGTVVRLEGGPGGGGVSAARARYYSSPESEDMRAVANQVFFDQRGIGYSEPAFCRAVPQNYQFGEAMAGKGTALYFEAMRRCYEEARSQGVQIAAYSNWENSLDVRDLRRALGLTQWTIFGISYGTQLGQGVMRVDPEGTRAAILDSVVAEGYWFTGTATAANFRTSLDVIAGGCRAQSACAKSYPDLRGRFYDAIRAYRETPLLIDGLSQSISMTGRVVADDTALANLLFQMLYNNRLYRDFPILLDALEKRNVDALRAYVEAGAPPLNHHYGSGMGHAIGCRSGEIDSGASVAQDKELAETAEWFGRNKPLCALIDPASPDQTTGLVTSDIPTLVLAGDADPITPARHARSILRGLSRGTYVEFPMTGHGAARSNGKCGSAILIAFIANPEVRPDIRCVSQAEAPLFVTSWRATPKAFHFLTTVQDGARPIAPIVLALGLVFALFAYPLAAIGRWLERARRTVGGAWRLLRLTSWAGALLTLGGLALAGKLIRDWSAEHALAVPLALPDSIALAGLLALVGALVASYAAIGAWMGRKARIVPVGTLAGATIVALCAVGALMFLFSIGSGPFLL